MIEVNDTAPDFTLAVTGGGEMTLSSLQGSPVVLFFYPRDDTPGCTKESIAFTGLMSEFAALDCKVFGISREDIKSHDKFIAKHDLETPLLSDEDGAVCEAYGVWVEKSMYGKKFMGIERSTFLIDGDGKIAQAWRKVKVPGHAEAVLDAVRAL